ncbi:MULTISPECIES: bifunctional 3-(3-hydroxy-phenyl)propionate/3-hydroxycinnamic acid hydroxylase [unclassified Phaeobacter]|uniref:bifunctional 3-(3-hydroxy-phenyl)propionate/3-hydroxycinnamic acid hydroxylase MhpA n=1 Tax=unclassified Phaeobacter TaxID=2621772 RepID=UPI003A838F71
MSIFDVDVAIVGYGPTGATLANLLAQCGVRVAVVERESAMYHLPRAVHFDGETMRVFQAVGIADQLREKVRVNPGMRFVDPDGNLLMDWPRPQDVGPQGWHASYRLHQPDLEHLLRDKLAGNSNATVLNNTEVMSVEETEKGATLLARSIGGGHQTRINAQYVVGCDGARSFVRKSIGSGMDDLGFDERWLVVDVLLKRDRPDLGDHSVQFCDPVRPMTYCRSPGVRRRWEITVLDGEADAEVTQDSRIWEFLAPWIGPQDATLERSAVYTFRSAVAQKWRKRRLMIAGDAAHLTPPFMGQGMCAGIRDAANLAWKLALCIKGCAPDDLLESYQEERSPNVRQFIETAVRLGGLINTGDPKIALSQANTDQTGTTRMASIAPPLGASDLGGLVPRNAPHAGQLFSQLTLSDGHLLDDVVGYTPVLILRHCLPDNIATHFPVFDAEQHPNVAPALDAIGANAVLIRPDKYIAASAVTEMDIAALAGIALPSPLLKHEERELAL